MRAELVNIRIDERLIHGQIAAAWAGSLKITRIMVVDAEAVKTEIQKIALKMACPQGVKLSILSPEKAALNINSGKYTGERILLVTKGPASIQRLLEAGLDVEEVNVGNMSGRKGTYPVKKAVYVTEEEERLFCELAGRVRFNAQLVPSDPRVDFIELLNQAQKG